MSTFVRQPAVAGMFYSDDAIELASDIESMLDQVQPVPHADALRALIVPHAGYVYSGLTAAHAYALLRSIDLDTILLVGPSHREYFNGAAVFSGDAYKTPLGDMEVDTAMRDRLVEASPLIHASMSGHQGEHALEVQIPFLQIVCPGKQIVPIVMGDQREETCLELGRALAQVASGTKSILIASSDLSHFYSSSVARRLDGETIRFIQSLDEEDLLAGLDDGRAEACGGGPIVAIIRAAKDLGAKSCTLLHSCNSGDVTGDRDRVVGYCSAAIWSAQ